ncbi:transposase [uncultured Enterococcus sp.]|uniref:transposase n=1 Tax=uncultured Enterococcus sp. TaxID=167972 RepID=UPI0034549BD2
MFKNCGYHYCNDDSSGPHVRIGAITKQGNGTIRTTLIEAANALVRSNIGYLWC